MKFKGVGPKTAAIVLQFSLDMPAFPVDTHIYRVTGRLGLRPKNMDVKLPMHTLKRFSPQLLLCGTFEYDQTGKGDMSSLKTGMFALPPA